MRPLAGAHRVAVYLMKRWLKEPLVHFVALGALFFALNAYLGGRPARAGEIVVPQGRIENIAALFHKTWQREPTPTELRSLVDDYVLEEALYREGLAQGVDRNDTVIRRRIRQKMEFVVEDIAELAQPTAAELEAWLAEHADDYKRPGRFRFRQIFLNPSEHGDALEANATVILGTLRAAPADFDPRPLGDPALFEHAFPDIAARDVDKTFGDDFAQQLAGAEVGAWSGPVTSTYGLHLVFVDQHVPGDLPPLAEVRAAVARDWSYAERRAAAERFYSDLVGRYDLRIEWPVETEPAR